MFFPSMVFEASPLSVSIEKECVSVYNTGSPHLCVGMSLCLPGQLRVLHWMAGSLGLSSCASFHDRDRRLSWCTSPDPKYLCQHVS